MAEKKVTRDAAPDVTDANPDTVIDVRSPREIRWDNATTWPMVILSLVFLVAYSYWILDDQPFQGRVDIAVLLVMVFTYIAFITDFFVRLHLSGKRWRFVRANIIDLTSLLLPLLRPLLLLEYLGRLRWFRHNSGSSVRARIIVYATGSSILFIYVVSLSVYACERHAPGATIVSFGDAMWWAMCTVSTVGYGDVVPVTVPGRMFAVLLMLGGMAIVGAATATIVSAMGERISVASRRAQHYSRGATSSPPSQQKTTE